MADVRPPVQRRSSLSPRPRASSSTLRNPSRTFQRMLHLTPDPNSLATLTLSNLLSNQTCPPISFPDFALFIERKEFTLENLLFVVWFRSYRQRWEALSDDEKRGVPTPDTRLGKRRDPFGYLALPVGDDGGPSTGPGPPPISPIQRNISDPPLHGFTVCDWSKENYASRLTIPTSINTDTTPSPRTKRSDSVACGQCPGCKNPSHQRDVKSQPMRLEAARAYATFLRKGGSRELGIADDLREECALALEGSTAPEVFLPIYEETYHVIETQSLPHFLSYAKVNVNRPKQLFWYYVGAVDFLIALAIFLPLLLLLPPKPFGLRAYRLFSVPFASFGCMQAYSAYRGFCSQVWRRASRQLKPWEMDLGEDEEDVLEGLEPLFNFRITNTKDKTQKGAMEMQERGTESTSTQGSVPLSTPQSFADPFALAPGTTAVVGEDTLSDLPSRGAYARSDDGPGSSPWSSTKDDSKSPDVAGPLWSPRFDPISDGEAMSAHLSKRRATAPIITAVPFPSSDKVFPFNEAERSAAAARFEIFPFDSPFGDPGATGQLRPRKPSVLSGGFVFDEPDPEGTGLRSGSVNTILTSRMRQPSTKSTVNCTPGSSELGEMRKMSVFGPEQAVLDPRVKKLFDDVVRDILVLGGLVAAVWTALCLAIPGQG